MKMRFKNRGGGTVTADCEIDNDLLSAVEYSGMARYLTRLPKPSECDGEEEYDVENGTIFDSVQELDSKLTKTTTMLSMKINNILDSVRKLEKLNFNSMEDVQLEKTRQRLRDNLKGLKKPGKMLREDGKPESDQHMKKRIALKAKKAKLLEKHQIQDDFLERPADYAGANPELSQVPQKPVTSSSLPPPPCAPPPPRVAAPPPPVMIRPTKKRAMPPNPTFENVTQAFLQQHAPPPPPGAGPGQPPPPPPGSGEPHIESKVLAASHATPPTPAKPEYNAIPPPPGKLPTPGQTTHPPPPPPLPPIHEDKTQFLPIPPPPPPGKPPTPLPVAPGNTLVSDSEQFLAKFQMACEQMISNWICSRRPWYGRDTKARRFQVPNDKVGAVYRSPNIIIKFSDFMGY